MKQRLPEILRLLSLGKGAWMTTRFSGSSGTVSDLKRTLTPISFEHQTSEVEVFAPDFTEQENSITVREPILPPQRLIILGGGHISHALCPAAVSCGFRVIVVDDRPEFANEQRFPTAERVICGDFLAVLDTLNVTPLDFVAILTRGHAHDGDCLKKLLTGSFPAYLGMIGSRRRVSAQLEGLEQEGFSRALLDRICTPIGLPIGAVTPEEIAISILSQLIAYKRLPQYQSGKGVIFSSDLEISTLEMLQNRCEPYALVTIIRTTGSTPRGTGAKMAVFGDGSIVGTVGGGMGEAAAIRQAHKLLGTGCYTLLTLDMTGEVAQREGMVCGGTMTLLIEDVLG